LHTNQQEEGSISILAEFNDKVLESEYTCSDMRQSIWHLRYIMILSAIITLALLLTDFYFIRNMIALTVIAFISVCYIALIFIIIRKVKIIKIINNYFILLTIYLYFFSCTVLYNILFFEFTPDIFSNDFLLLSAILFISLTPNRWIYSLVISISTSITFLIYSSNELLALNGLKLAANLILLFCIITLILSYRYKRNISQRQHFIVNKKLLILAATDPLTGISNRSKFDEMLGYWIEKANNYNISITLAMFDFDDFKKVNDSQGHMIGDEVILKTVGLISEGIRKRDILARWGGEEFMILFPDTKMEESIQIVERLRNVIEEHTFYNDIHITASFGIAQLMPGEGFNEYVERTDKLLYEAKANGKNCLKY